jgi:hypothetical protein
MPYSRSRRSVEKGVAAALRNRGYFVIGTHSCGVEPDNAQLEALVNIIEGTIQQRA